ncbi:MAG: ABC transporter ATP-binding protein [Lachnospiraceae bacterium]|nr:ABC transporter ATP-binding protein [Lachnospiraceae bacterium]
MNLKFDLPAAQQSAFTPADGEEIRYCSPYDIGTDGRLKHDGYIVVTNQRLLIISGAEVETELALKDITFLKCDPLVNNGILIVRTEQDPEERILARFTMKHVSRVAFIAKGALLLRDGVPKQVISREYDKTCPVCGRALRGTKECPKCSHKPSVLWKFFKLCGAYKGWLAIIALLMLGVAVVQLVIPKIQQVFIDDYLKAGRGGMKEILIYAGILIGITIITILLHVLRYWMCISMGTKMSMDLRQMLYKKVQILSLSFIQDRRPGELMNRIVDDTRQVRRFMEEAFAGMFSCIISMISVVVVMLTMDWKLTLMSVVFVPIALGLSISFRKNIHRRFHMQWHRFDKTNSGLQDILAGMRVVKSFGTEKQETEHFRKLTDDFAKVQERNEVFWASLFPIISFVMGMGVYVVTYFGGVGVLEDRFTVGQLQQFINYTWMLYGPLGWMTFLPRMITQLMTSLERIYDVMDEEPLIKDNAEAVDLDIKGEVEFKDVTFGYRSYEPVLEKINLKVKPGEMIGLVGASGTGKSTLINLIMRLYEVDDGHLLIDGVDINNLRIEKYHSQIGVVLQENFLFAGTIYNNLRFAKPDATEEEIIMAAKMANAHDFIVKTPDGYNTYVGEHGYSLSGGERQRLAIARAILNKPRLLILDEATSALDTESEYLIQKALERLTAGCTTFAIAHRLSTLKDADRLVVIDGHHIAEVGTHNELMEKKGIYYGLVTAQLQMQALKGEDAAAAMENAIVADAAVATDAASAVAGA